MFFSLFDYLKTYETKISESEVPELQFLSVELYKSETFNVNSITKIISTKLNDTNYLINQLKLTVAHLKNEIVEQINSNFQNYVVLISKLQALDFLIENIEKPLEDIKNKIISEINFAEKYEGELNQILSRIKDNENQIKIIKLSIRIYKSYNRCKEIIKQVESKYLSNNLIKNIFMNHPEEDILEKDNYEILRKFLVDIFRFLSNVKCFYEVSERLSRNGDDISQVVNEIKQVEIKFMIQIEDLLKILLNEYFKCDELQNDNQSYKNLLLKNLLILTLKLYYIIPKNELILFNKILESSLTSEIDKIFENSKNLVSKFQEMMRLYDGKYKEIQEVLNNITKHEVDYSKSEFFLHCFVAETINRVSSDKFVFNCVDFGIFRENYSSFLNYIGKFITKDKFDKFNETDIQIIRKVINFSQSFSFFTYFQYLQGDILKILLEDYGKLEIENADKNFSPESLEKNFVNQSNLLLNFTKIIENIFIEKKLFLKNIPNFIFFIGQSIKYIINKQKQLFADDNLKHLMTLFQIREKFSFSEGNMLNLKEALVEYANTFYLMISFLFNIFDVNDRSKFKKELSKIIEREIFIFENFEEYKKLEDDLCKFIENNMKYVEENISISEEPFFKFVSENLELRIEIKFKLI
jgi:hypothetical protein